jgi:hypothetical protein
MWSFDVPDSLVVWVMWKAPKPANILATLHAKGFGLGQQHAV